MASRLTTTLRTLAKFTSVPVGTTTVDTAAALLNSGALKLPDLSYDYGALEPTIIGEIMELHHSKHHNTYVTNLKVALEKYVEAKKAHDTAGAWAESVGSGFHGLRPQLPSASARRRLLRVPPDRPPSCARFAAIEAAESGIVFNGGGHYNHSLFWKMLAPPAQGGGEPPSGELAAAIARDFGSFEVRAAAGSGPGSGRVGAVSTVLTLAAAAQRFKERFNATAAPVQGSGWGWLGYDMSSKALTVGVAERRGVVNQTLTLRRRRS